MMQNRLHDEYHKDGVFPRAKHADRAEDREAPVAHTDSYAADVPAPPGPGVPKPKRAPGPCSPPDAPVCQHEQAFAAVLDQVREARRFLERILDDRLPSDDAIICLSELASNAITHSSSRGPGGRFIVRVSVSGEHLRVEVLDDGGPWTERPASEATRGRGLLIVSQLTRDWGRIGLSQTGWNVWFEIDCRRQTNPQTREEAT